MRDYNRQPGEKETNGKKTTTEGRLPRREKIKVNINTTHKKRSFSEKVRRVKALRKRSYDEKKITVNCKLASFDETKKRT